MDSTAKFNGRAAFYTASRPSYAKELIDYLYRDCGMTASSIITDIGSGTGKFAKQLLERGSTVYCVEPNEDMRRVAENELYEYKNFHSIQGSAENTTLSSNFSDFITVAQAFHWFDVDKFKRECSRIIKDEGKVILVWNIRDSFDPLNQELSQIYAAFCPHFKGFSGGIVKDDPRIRVLFDGQYEYTAFTNPLYFNREKFIERSLSSSYSLKERDEDYEEYIKALTTLFSRYSNNGVVSIANQSVAYIGTIHQIGR